MFRNKSNDSLHFAPDTSSCGRNGHELKEIGGWNTNGEGPAGTMVDGLAANRVDGPGRIKTE